MNRMFALLSFLLLAACQPQSSETPPLAGSAMGGAFALTDQDGKPASDSDFSGRYRLVYFGYTYCPDVCPLDLQRLMAGYRLFESEDAALAGSIQPIFISVDPKRDTPPRLKEFVSAFHPKLIGLTGSEAQIADVAKRFRVYFELGKADKTGAYSVDHTRSAILYGHKGEPLAIIPQDGSAAEIAAELKRWAK
jgi:protein SCO1